VYAIQFLHNQQQENKVGMQDAGDKGHALIESEKSTKSQRILYR
jgi:hypothetical protein